MHFVSLVALSSVFLFGVINATPPACFLSCLSEASRKCPRNHADIACICDQKDLIIGCLVDICPYGTFESSRDHFLGTCLEHNKDVPAPPPYTSPDFDHPHSTSTSTASPTAVPTPEYPTPEYPAPEYPVPAPTPTPTPEPTLEPKYPDDSDCEDDKDHEAETDCDSDKDDYEEETDCGSDEDEPQDDNQEEEDVDCEWEEEETVDKHGNVLIIRKPIKVPEKHRKKPSSDPIRRKVIIRRPSQIKSSGSDEIRDEYGPGPNIKIVKKYRSY